MNYMTFIRFDQALTKNRVFSVSGWGRPVTTGMDRRLSRSASPDRLGKKAGTDQ